MHKPFNLTIPITKVDEEKRMVWGFATVEEIDKHGEIIGYEASKKAFGNWVGNIREMHDATRTVGKKIEVEFDDEKKGVWLGSFISESADGENAWIKVKEGILLGYSIGGAINDYVTEKMEVNGKMKNVVTITDYDLSEVSLVDNPACPSAMLEIVKSDGTGLQQTEVFHKGTGLRVPWFYKTANFGAGYDVIAKNVINYNRSNMDKKATLQKDIWGASSLLYICRELAYYVYGEAYDGKPTDDLIAALNTLKEAAATELVEDEVWPETVTRAIALATKTLNLTKSQVEEKMSDEISKTVVGQEDRDADGNVVATAEENGKPADVTAEETETAVAEAEATETPKEEVKEPKKAAAPADLEKGVSPDDLIKSISAEVGRIIAPLAERLDKLEGEPVAVKAKASFTEVEKSDQAKMEKGMETVNAAEEEYKKLLERIDVLAKDATAGTPRERVDLAIKARKLVRALDPASVQQAQAIRAHYANR